MTLQKNITLQKCVIIIKFLKKVKKGAKYTRKNES